MHKFIAAAGLSLLAFPVLAICEPPKQVVFACDIVESERQVEVCGVPSETSADSMSEIIFLSALRNQQPDIYFKTHGAADSTFALFQTYSFAGVAYEDGGRLYTIYASGSFETGALYQGMVEIYDSQEAFNSPDPDQHSVRWECAYGTLQGYNYDFFRP